MAGSGLRPRPGGLRPRLPSARKKRLPTPPTSRPWAGASLPILQPARGAPSTGSCLPTRCDLPVRSGGSAVAHSRRGERPLCWLAKQRIWQPPSARARASADPDWAISAASVSRLRRAPQHQHQCCAMPFCCGSYAARSQNPAALVREGRPRCHRQYARTGHRHRSRQPWAQPRARPFVQQWCRGAARALSRHMAWARTGLRPMGSERQARSAVISTALAAARVGTGRAGSAADIVSAAQACTGECAGGASVRLRGSGEVSVSPRAASRASRRSGAG
eukprot:scaffold31609_cov90-Isochrysis_galbana.AAC.2